MNANTDSKRSHVRTLLTLLSVLVVVVVAGYLVSTSSQYRFLKHWGEAEAVAEDVKRLSENLEILNSASIGAMLDSKEFVQLKSRRIDIAPGPGELVWFRANDMYNVGLADDGVILFMRDGQR